MAFFANPVWIKKEHDFNTSLACRVAAFWIERAGVQPAMRIETAGNLRDDYFRPVFGVRSDMLDGLPRELHR